VGKTDWLEEGIAVLRESGPDALRIDRLARRLGLTKGSFHHHFAGTPDYRRTLLEYCTARDAEAIDAVLQQLSGLPPAEAIAALADAPLIDLPLDRALRAWAVGDAEARTAMEHIDGTRLSALESLWRRVLPDPAAARTAALVPYLITAGAGTVAVTATDLQRVYALLARLIPAVGS
jgi:AcrR family transcriptional regulator